MSEPNDFDFNSSLEKLQNTQPDLIDLNSQDIDDNLSPERIKARKQQIERLFKILIGLGLAFGAILSIGIVILFNKLGLSDKPYEIEKKQQQEQEQETDSLTDQTYEFKSPNLDNTSS